MIDSVLSAGVLSGAEIELKVINPYDIERMIGVVVWREKEAKWFLFGPDGKRMSSGYSCRGTSINCNRQAMINCQAFARRYMQKKYPLFCSK
jgi:hypothetical protein